VILRRVIAHVRKQEWTAIAIDFAIVVVASAFSTSGRRSHDPSPD